MTDVSSSIMRHRPQDEYVSFRWIPLEYSVPVPPLGSREWLLLHWSTTQPGPGNHLLARVYGVLCWLCPCERHHVMSRATNEAQSSGQWQAEAAGLASRVPKLVGSRPLSSVVLAYWWGGGSNEPCS